MPAPCLRLPCLLIHEVGTALSPILQTKKPGHREVKPLSQGHTAELQIRKQ